MASDKARAAIRRTGGRLFGARLIRGALAAAMFAAAGACSTFEKAGLVKAESQAAPKVSENIAPPADASQGWRLLEAGQVAEAVAAFRSRLAAAPEDSDARYGYAEALRHGGRFDMAEAEYLKVADDPQYRVRALEGIGHVRLSLGDNEGAYEALTAAVEEGGESWRAWLGLAQLRDLARDWPTADAAYAEALEAGGAPATVHNNHGVSMLARGDAAAAAALFRKALAEDPSSERAATNLELALAAQGGAGAGLAENEPDPKLRAQKLNNFGYVAMLQGRLDEAEGLFRKAIAAHPSFYSVAYENLSIVKNLQAQQKRDE
jgi:Flp pilus assembly protein TadD